MTAGGQIRKVREYFKGSNTNRHLESAVRSLATTMMLVAMAAPAYAQFSPGNGAPGNGSPEGGRPSITMGGDKKAKTEDEIKYERRLDQAYKSGLSKIPDQKPKADPWGSIRGAATTPAQSNSNQRRPSSK
jgi:hypothetical protein